MKKQKINNILIVIIVSLAFFVGFLLTNSDWVGKKKLLNRKSDNKIGRSETNGSILSSVDERWDLYTNYDLGFSIEIPKKVDSWCGDSKLSEVGVFEEKSHVYIDRKYVSDVDSSECVENNLARLGEKVPSLWKIVVSSVSNNKQLDDFIKLHYGQGCTFNRDDIGLQDKTYSFGVDTSKTSAEECFSSNPDYSKICCVNYGHVIKYNPVLGKVATWSIGHDAKFVFTDSEETEFYDMKIGESFKFIGN